MHVPRQVSPLRPFDDAELVDRVRRSDADACRMLYARHARYVAGVVFRLLGADQDVDDIVQEAFVDALEGIGALKDPARLRSWLVTIAVRKVNRVLSARRLRRRLTSSLALLVPNSQAPMAGWSVDELGRALDELPAKLRVAWILGRVEQLELTEVASICAISLATAKRRIAEAEQRLRRWLDDR